MRVIVTGSRKWADVGAVWDALWDIYKQHGPFELRHGACATGADAQAHDWFVRVGAQLSCTELRFPANWERGPQAGPERNARMVEAGADLVLAFPLPEGSGTQCTMRLAREAGIEVIVYGRRGDVMAELDDSENQALLEGQEPFRYPDPVVVDDESHGGAHHLYAEGEEG